MNFILFLVPFGILIFRRDRVVLLLFWIFSLQVAYSIYIGGDAWEGWGGSNRFICLVMPVFFVIFSSSLAHLFYQFSGKVSSPQLKPSGRTRKYIYRCGFLILVVMSIVNFNAIYGLSALKELLLIRNPYHTEDNRKMVEKALLLRKITSPEAKVAVVWAGAIPYFSDRYCIDILGKNDKYVARQKMRLSPGLTGFLDFYPGHLKYDYEYSIGRLKPDAVTQLWGYKQESKPYLEGNYRKIRLEKKHSFFLRNGSSNILWCEIEPLSDLRSEK